MKTDNKIILKSPELSENIFIQNCKGPQLNRLGYTY